MNEDERSAAVTQHLIVEVVAGLGQWGHIVLQIVAHLVVRAGLLLMLSNAVKIMAMVEILLLLLLLIGSDGQII